jgi:hypothetical protein
MPAGMTAKMALCGLLDFSITDSGPVVFFPECGKFAFHAPRIFGPALPPAGGFAGRWARRCVPTHLLWLPSPGRFGWVNNIVCLPSLGWLF